MGLIDELVAEPAEPALGGAQGRSSASASRSRPAAGKTLLTQWPARGLLAKKMRAETAKKVREEHYPAPFRLIDLFETHGGNLEAHEGGRDARLRAADGVATRRATCAACSSCRRC